MVNWLISLYSENEKRKNKLVYLVYSE